jgi:hypothetical protein
METLQVSSICHDGTIYVFPAWEDGSIPIMATTGHGSAVRVILDREGARKLGALLTGDTIAANEIVAASL